MDLSFERNDWQQALPTGESPDGCNYTPEWQALRWAQDAGVPIVGRVSMDLMTIDVTALGDAVRVGDWVEIFGPQVPIEDLAERVAVAVDHAGRAIVAVAFELAAGGDVRIVTDVQRFHRLRRQQQRVVAARADAARRPSFPSGCGGSG